MENQSIGLLDNKALNRSVHFARVGLVVGWSYLPLYPTTVFTTSTLFDASVNAGVIQLGLCFVDKSLSKPKSH
ncbi:hypothetical protein MFFC18_18520 [Mariniblastus fucicola]|uniref:Uncharacterized protein n=1 Tax=Mariniblastus fucicola TaxID=980251 RepID=A0A5B9PGH0_9BACT|nr:hypothetical protein MFFC18_18520 [Mariniblastus fucicola]